MTWEAARRCSLLDDYGHPRACPPEPGQPPRHSTLSPASGDLGAPHPTRCRDTPGPSTRRTPAYEAIQNVGETDFHRVAVEQAQGQLRDGLPLRAEINVVGYLARKAEGAGRA